VYLLQAQAILERSRPVRADQRRAIRARQAVLEAVLYGGWVGRAGERGAGPGRPSTPRLTGPEQAQPEQTQPVGPVARRTGR